MDFACHQEVLSQCEKTKEETVCYFNEVKTIKYCAHHEYLIHEYECCNIVQ